MHYAFFIWQAVKNQGKRFRESGVPIHGIGIQSHLRDGDVDITAIKVTRYILCVFS